MARKRRVKDSPEYWEKKLREAGLSMEAGTSRRMTYVGSSSTLEWVAGKLEEGTLDISRIKTVTYKQK